MPSPDSATPVPPAEGGIGPAFDRHESGVPEFSAVYRQYFEFVWACTRRFGVSEHELDDVVQEIFIVIHGRLATIEKPESLRSWIYGVVRRTASTHRRSKRSKAVSDNMLAFESPIQYPAAPSPQDLAEQSAQVRLLWQLLEKLSPNKREVFVLAELDEMTVPEIATALELPVNTVYSRLRHARLELDEALQRHNARENQRGRSCPT